MYKNIRNNNVRSLGFRLRNDKYYDFMIYRGEVMSKGGVECLAAEVNAHEIEDNRWYSEITWKGAVNRGVELSNIGYTGIDNGLISYRRDKITNSQFLDIFTNSKMVLDENDKRFFLIPVTGNSNQYKYHYSLENDESGEYFALKGGFFQGFFKLDGFDYQTLPHVIENDWNFEFVLRKRDYEIQHRTLNNNHPENNGIFFYIGTRAENKFCHYYKKNEFTEELFNKNCSDEDYFADFKPSKTNVTQHDYFSPEEETGKASYNSKCDCKCNRYSNEEGSFFVDSYFSGDDYFSFDENLDDVSLGITYDDIDVETLNRQDYLDFSLCCGKKEANGNKKGDCLIDNYFSDDYVMGDDCEFFDEDYFEKEISLEGLEIFTKDGYDITKKGYYNIVTDNKFLTFDRTKLGFTTKTYDETNPFVRFEGRNDWGSINYFELLNRSTTGYTTKTIMQYNESVSKSYDVYKDLRENAFCLKINEDGSIGYRYAVTNCENESKYDVIEEYSKSNIVKTDEWCTINARIFLLNSSNTSCGIKQGKRRMKIYIYVNGNLVLISKELPEFNFRALDEISDKQEGVPYNISVGGGSQGLADVILLKYYDVSDYTFPIERDFCGTFLGDIKTFRFYDCFREYNSINSKVFKV